MRDLFERIIQSFKFYFVMRGTNDDIILFQDGAGRERGPAGGGSDGQQVLVRCSSDIQGDGCTASKYAC